MEFIFNKQTNYYIGLSGCTKVAVAILSDNLTMCRQEEWNAPVVIPEE